MVKVLIVYYSRTGNTKKMAESIGKGVLDSCADVTIKSVENTKYNEFLDYDAIIIGSPTYYGHSAGVIRTLFDESVKIHGRLDGKVGGAFTSSGNKAGGNETAILDILHALMIHGMIVKGSYKGDHYGPVSVCAPTEKEFTDCEAYGKSIVALVNKLVDKK